MAMQKGTQVPGQKCTVTSGPNKGKSGTYTTDEEGNTWCEGDWGGTQCGENKCKDAKSAPTIFDTIVDGKNVVEVEGFYSADDQRLFWYQGAIDVATGERLRAVAIPVSGTTSADLQSSDSEADRVVASVVEPLIKQYRRDGGR